MLGIDINKNISYFHSHLFLIFTDIDTLSWLMRVDNFYLYSY